MSRAPDPAGDQPARAGMDHLMLQTPPARIRAAFELLAYCDHVEARLGPFDSLVGRALTKSETATREAALALIRQYLLGEMDLGDQPLVLRQAEGQDDGPGDVPAPVRPRPRKPPALQPAPQSGAHGTGGG